MQYGMLASVKVDQKHTIARTGQLSNEPAMKKTMMLKEDRHESGENCEINRKHVSHRYIA